MCCSTNHSDRPVHPSINSLRGVLKQTHAPVGKATTSDEDTTQILSNPICHNTDSGYHRLTGWSTTAAGVITVMNKVIDEGLFGYEVEHLALRFRLYHSHTRFESGEPQEEEEGRTVDPAGRNEKRATESVYGRSVIKQYHYYYYYLFNACHFTGGRSWGWLRFI